MPARGADPALRDQGDEALLNAVQAEVPLTPRPFAALAQRLGEDEATVLARYQRLKDAGVIRQTSAILDTERLGYHSTLVAARVPEPRLAEAAEVVSSHPGVSHNYRREHDFNLWWTLAVPPGGDLSAHAHALHRRAGAEATRLLPTLTRYKIGVRLDVGGSRPMDATEERGPQAAAPRTATDARALSDDEVALVRELQEDLPAEPRPFAAMATRLGTDEDALLAAARRLDDEGVMRRFAAVLRHRRAGFGANAMSVWRADEAEIDEHGGALASFAAVTHCYRRLTHHDWPYPLFAMIHATSRERVAEAVVAMRERTGLDEPLLLYSTTEFKKVRLRYFDPAHTAWEAEYVTDADRGAAASSPHAW